MRWEGKRFSATRRMLSSRAAVSGSKPSRTRMSSISSTDAPRWTLCATHSFHSCVISRCAMGLGTTPRAAGSDPLVPDLARALDDARELRPLLVLGKEVAVVRAREAALGRQAQVLERHGPGRLVDAALERLLALQRAGLRGHQAEHHLLPLGQQPQRPESAGALAVVLHEEA